MDELKPCPFCGGEAGWWDETESDTYPYQIFCKQCWCGTDEMSDKDRAVEAWNRRIE